MILAALIFLFSIIQLKRWLPRCFRLKSGAAAAAAAGNSELSSSAAAEVDAARSRGGGGGSANKPANTPAAEAPVGLSVVAPDSKPQDAKPVDASTAAAATGAVEEAEEEEYDDDMAEGLLGGLWNLNSALQFGQEYEWIYKAAETASLELGDATLAALYNQASGLLTELYEAILLKYAQFTSVDAFGGVVTAEDVGATFEFRVPQQQQHQPDAGSGCAAGRVPPAAEGEVPAKKRRVSAEPAQDDDRIAAVEPDEMNPAMQWGLRHKDVEAEKHRKLDVRQGFSFSAAGLLFPYYLGACQCLKERDHIREDTPLAGSSAGALVCAVVAGGLDMRDALEATKELGRECRQGGTAFKLGAVLRTFLNKFLPEDIHLRANGRIRVSVTQLFGSPRGLLVDQFDSKEDLLDALLASCHIPLYFASWPVTRFRNRICVDGGLTFFMPPTSAKHTIRISAFPALTTSLRFGEPEISPDCNPSPKRPSLFQLARWALVPAENDQMEQLFELGYQDALVWCREQ